MLVLSVPYAAAICSFRPINSLSKSAQTAHFIIADGEISRLQHQWMGL